MDSFYLGDVLGVRRGTAPAARTSAFEDQFFASRFAPKDGEKDTGAEQDPEDVSAHMACALDWLRTPSGAPSPLAAPFGDVVAKAPSAPAWARDARCCPPGSRVLHVDAPACKVRGEVRAFLADGGMPCEIAEDEASWKIHGTVFVDYTAIEVELGFYETAAATSVLSLKHTSARDVVLFSQLLGKVLTFLGARGLAAREERMGAACGPGPRVVDDFDEEDLFSEEEAEAWEERIGAVLHSAGCGSAAAREDSWRALARWGEASPDCHSHLAAALFAGDVGPGLVTRALRAGPSTPLSEAYPLAMALKSAVLGLEASPRRPAAADLAELLLASAENFPRLVAGEFRRAGARLA